MRPVYQIVSGPVVEPVSLADMKLHLRLGAAEHPDDELVEVLIAAAREWVEDVTGLALITQTWDMFMPWWPRFDHFRIGKPPLQSVEYIQYTDTERVVRTFDSGLYDVDAASRPGLVRLAYGMDWPRVDLYPTNPVNIRFTAGYGAAADVPGPIVAAIKLLVGHLYENREDTVVGISAGRLPMGVDALLANYRFWVA